MSLLRGFAYQPTPSVECVIGNKVVENSWVVEMVSEAGVGSSPVVSLDAVRCSVIVLDSGSVVDTSRLAEPASIGDSVVDELPCVAVVTVEISSVGDSSDDKAMVVI